MCAAKVVTDALDGAVLGAQWLKEKSTRMVQHGKDVIAKAGGWIARKARGALHAIVTAAQEIGARMRYAIGWEEDYLYRPDGVMISNMAICDEKYIVDNDKTPSFVLGGEGNYEGASSRTTGARS